MAHDRPPFPLAGRPRSAHLAQGDAVRQIGQGGHLALHAGLQSGDVGRRARRQLGQVSLHGGQHTLHVRQLRLDGLQLPGHGAHRVVVLAEGSGDRAKVG
jgi:hypothetical protein